MAFKKFREEMGVGYEILAEDLEELKEVELPDGLKKRMGEDLRKYMNNMSIKEVVLRDHGDEYVLEIKFRVPDPVKGGFRKTQTTKRRYEKGKF